METPLGIMQAHYKQRDLAAREWKRKGGQVVGYFCDTVPVELIIAAGFFPLWITGDRSGSTEIIDEYLEPVYEGFVRSAANVLLTGHYDFVDYLVISRSRDSIAQLYSHLSQIKALNPSVKLPELYPFDLNNNRSYTSQFYNRDRVRDLANQLQEWSGGRISDASLTRAIATTNESRKLLSQVAALRAAAPPRLSGVEALQIIGSSMFMVREEHNRLLREFLAGADQLPLRSGARLFVEASPLDNVQFYELLESCGATVVADDHCWGNRYGEDLIETSGDPIESIAYRYQYKAPGPEIVFPPGLRADYCVRKTIEAKAEAVVFYVYEWDTLQAWDYPEQDSALKTRGIPSRSFLAQKYVISDPEALKADLKSWIAALERKST